jgi:hypothetical protein
MKTFILSLVAMALCACASSTENAAPIPLQQHACGASLIVPGQCIGAVQAGVAISDETRVAGTPTATHAQQSVNECGVAYTYAYGDIYADANRNSAVRLVETCSSKYRTEEGLGVGSLSSDFIATFGTPDWTDTPDKGQWVAVGYDRGISYRYNIFDNRVFFVGVYRPQD